MLTDEVKIKISAGRGGDGAVAFDKIKMSLGPTGGRGGNGGNVYFSGTTNLAALNKFKHKREYWAEDGRRGKSDRGDGLNGKDIALIVPIGSVIHNLDTGKDIDIVEADQPILVAKGGFGGRGNFYFRSSTNTSPRQSEEGKPGEQFNLFIELRLIAQIGLIGLPSAGKSSLLNELAGTNVKTAQYPFTTLEPNLGTIGNIIVADIPGLIEGASQGKGLGTKFLRHIQRTKIIAHCLSLESNDLVKDYESIRKELAEYDEGLSKKEEIIILTKSDLVLQKEIEKKHRLFAKKNKRVFVVSIYDLDSILRLSHELKNELEDDIIKK
jgi:GTPase